MSVFRKATPADIDRVTESYREFITHDMANEQWTIWQLGIYPDRPAAEKGIAEDTLYVLEEEDGELIGSMILNNIQPEEYRHVDWRTPAADGEVMVVHTLCIRPTKARQGHGKEMVRLSMEEGRRQGCKVIRLDTGSKNKPSKGLYTAMGFTLTAVTAIQLDGKIPDEGHVFMEMAL